jgi:hypothetical protein
VRSAILDLARLARDSAAFLAFHSPTMAPPQPIQVVVELVPVAGAEAPAAGPLVVAPAGTTEVPPQPQGRGSVDSLT